MSKQMPGAAGDLAEQYPDIWQAYAALGSATATCGPLAEREIRLVKLLWLPPVVQEVFDPTGARSSAVFCEAS